MRIFRNFKKTLLHIHEIKLATSSDKIGTFHTMYLSVVYHLWSNLCDVDTVRNHKTRWILSYMKLLSHKFFYITISVFLAESGSEHRVSSGGDQSESSYPRQQPAHVPEPPSEKQWNYSSLDLMGSGAAFWQNYSG